MKASRIILAVGVMLTAFNLAAFITMERWAGKLAYAEKYLTEAINSATDSSLQTSEPPIGLLINAIYTPDYGENVTDVTSAVGRWNGQSLIHTYYEDGRKIDYAVSHDRPDAWFPLPESLYAP